MSLLSNLTPKVKCGRCDRSYSGLHLKCPYCGAGRGRGGKRTTDATDASARRMIQLLLLLVLVVTVISMIVIDFDADPAESTPNTPPGMAQQTPQNGAGYNNGDEQPSPTPTPTPPPTPTPVAVTSINITWSAQRPGINEMTLRVGERLELWSEVFPTDADADIEWTIDTPTVANFTIDPEDFRRINLEARSVGQTILRATAGGESAEVIVRVR